MRLLNEHWCEVAEFARWAHRNVARIRAVHKIRVTSECRGPKFRMLLENARLLWDGGDRTAAFKLLEPVVIDLKSVSPADKTESLRVLLQVAQWRIESQYPHDEITGLLNVVAGGVCAADKELVEETNFCMAQCVA